MARTHYKTIITICISENYHLRLLGKYFPLVLVEKMYDLGPNVNVSIKCSTKDNTEL